MKNDTYLFGALTLGFILLALVSLSSTSFLALNFSIIGLIGSIAGWFVNVFVD